MTLIKIKLSVKMPGKKEEEYGIVIKSKDLKTNPHDLAGVTMMELWKFIKKILFKDKNVHFDIMEDGKKLSLQ